jgi:hypothetical protein
MLAIAATALIGRRFLGERTVGTLVAALALLVAAAQIPAIHSWFIFGRLTDYPAPTPFVTHWAYSVPHMLVGLLAVWVAARETGMLRRSPEGTSFQTG